MTRVVITGMGAVTPLGNDTKTFLDGLFDEKLGIKPITKFDATETGISVAGQVDGFDPALRVGKRDARKLDLFSQYAIDASYQALDQAGLLPDEGSEAKSKVANSERFGVILGNGIGGLTTIQEQVIKMHEKGPQRVSPLFVPESIPNMVSGNVSLRFGARGVNFTVVTACASATNAIGEAFWRIQSGREDVMLTGGSEATVNEIGIAGFAALTALSKEEDPAQASKPFDKNRHGFVLGEGSGILVLESLEHAEARGANILAEVVGYGASSDAYHMTSPAPDGEGAARAMKAALKDADIKPEDVTYLNAHGTATGANDSGEAEAVASVFGPNSVLVSSTKGMTGHLLGAAGAIEAVASVGAIDRGQLPVNVGFDEPDEHTKLVNLVNETNKNTAPEYVLSANYGFGGHNAAVVFKKW
ncbi:MULTISPECIES: beta-ketoacyl-ACP synthase II [Fructobacillus]|jgi:3-oxoacyl-[acyl-carrier-protein] synthase II|uniref:3-oxoacyl-[acyl-carrier-protein] synthase 2 n=3 Tax=Fructobacillus TaxID=559173 RepID=A0A3F3H359_9LACO|nr:MULTISPECIES: beta-ketoacyl-ACP synthase II [Fructobacillus]CAK1222076.1 3-oxoacyl-(acyl-carrier-protein) synthase (FabB) [Fructobacillus cardui]CAK1233346.1 3-oxoacyl-(acyl-carrier-protein) synthase (FabB) [Fructobacillus sp. LMG 32999]KMK53838.1 3-oxoacyl-[acyl-carrier-protein] synthase 2 [Fructobacillus sp. EFB-N1]NLS38388.1 beta-ketoacyl-ACP synthase II [Fructobacillus tropaeoli]CAK1230928.1 3-oxoacyl-(acyl-carrier-protein) synthase (FabB) [Fructobacillus tropaeoli]